MYFPEYNKAVRLYLVAIFRSLEVNKFIFIYIYIPKFPLVEQLKDYSILFIS